MKPFVDQSPTELLRITHEERAYLWYFATGDLNVQTHGRKIRTILSTTHPAMIEHVLDTFGPYGRSMAYPATSAYGYCWKLACDLPADFRFLTTKALDAPRIAAGNKSEFVEGLSGFGDAEGHVGIKKSGKWAKGRFKLCNRVARIVESFKKGLDLMSINASVYESHRKDGIMYELEVNDPDIMDLLPLLNLRHPEKVAAKRLVLKYHDCPWEDARTVYQNFRAGIKRQRNDFVKLAEIAAKIWPLRKAQRLDEIKRVRQSAKSLRLNGLRIQQIMAILARSERTVYRYLASG